MKTTKFIVAALTAVFMSANTFAQMHDHSKMDSLKTETFKAWGNCGMCKTRIEKAAKIEGVTKSEWDKDTKIISVTFNPDKTNVESLQKAIAAVGHDTEMFKAENKVYDKLPACCKYERSK
jgi:periplasmic mercuric ion binding protein